MKKTVTVKEAHDQIVASIGKYGWRHLNDYLRMRNIILFGEEEHCYVPNLDQLVSGKTIDSAIASLDNELIVSIGSETVRGYKLNVLSMGMTNDYETAIEEGATMVRVGTAIFGHRDYAK